jgi:cytoskeletal protein RodZ
MSQSKQSLKSRKGHPFLKSRQARVILALVSGLLGVVFWQIASGFLLGNEANTPGPDSNSQSTENFPTGSPAPYQSFSPNRSSSSLPGFSSETQTEPPDEASAKIKKFECNASLIIRENGTNQSIQLTLTTPKNVETAWASLDIGSNNSKLEINLSNGFTQKIIGQKSNSTRGLIQVRIYPAPIFNEGMELCKATR